MILQGNAKEQWPFEDDYFDAIVTSPPYFGLRKYGHSEDEIGTGSLSEYLHDLDAVFKEAMRTLKPEGLLWINVSDTASGSGGAGGDYNKGGKQHGRPKYKQGKSGLAPMQWCNVPARLAIILQERGWLQRAEITWDKERLRPEDLKHARRPGVSSEKIYLFAKSRDHVFYPEELTERGNVWHFPPEGRAKNHQAPFPIELPKRCIECSTQRGDMVFDPFVGRGTTVEAAEMLGRVGVGLDLYAED